MPPENNYEKISFDDLRSSIQEEVDNALNARLMRLNLALWGGVLAFVTASIVIGIQWGRLNTEVMFNTRSDMEHHTDDALHISHKEMQTLFVSRPELVRIEAAIARIEERLEKAAQKTAIP